MSEELKAAAQQIGACKLLSENKPTAYDAALLLSMIEEAERRAEQRVRAEIARDSERLDWCMYCDQTEFGGDCMHENPCPAWEKFKEEEEAIDAAREVG